MRNKKSPLEAGHFTSLWNQSGNSFGTQDSIALLLFIYGKNTSKYPSFFYPPAQLLDDYDYSFESTKRIFRPGVIIQRILDTICAADEKDSAAPALGKSSRTTDILPDRNTTDLH
jgi:hypothetical protein